MHILDRILWNSIHYAYRIGFRRTAERLAERYFPQIQNSTEAAYILAICEAQHNGTYTDMPF